MLSPLILSENAKDESWPCLIFTSKTSNAKTEGILKAISTHGRNDMPSEGKICVHKDGKKMV